MKKPATSQATNFARLVRQKRASTNDDYYDDVEKIDGRPAKPSPNGNSCFYIILNEIILNCSEYSEDQLIKRGCH